MKDWTDEITRSPLAVHLGATVANVTKIQEIDDPDGDTFKVILVSGVTAWGKLNQYEEAMKKYLDYLNLTYRKLCADLEEPNPMYHFNDSDFKVEAA